MQKPLLISCFFLVISWSFIWAAPPGPDEQDVVEKVLKEEEEIEETLTKDEEIPVSGETFGVPLPVYATDPNTGATTGVLLAVVSEYEGRISSILVPLASVNELTGFNLDFNVLGFPTQDISYFLLLSHTSENFWDYQFEYQQQNFLEDYASLDGRVGFENSASNRFHGIGADSEEDDETSFTLKEIVGFFSLRFEMAENFFVGAGIKARWLEPGDSVVDDVPSLDELFPDEEGVNESNYTVPLELSILYDSRNSLITPSAGVMFRAFLEVGDDAILSSFSFRRYGLEARGYFAWDEQGTYITAIRALIEFVDGEDIPFYELSSLGGKESLRGFGAGRFYDNHRFLINIEERIRVYRWIIGEINLDIETALFADIGQVFPSIADIRLEDIQVVLGAGVRFVVREQIVAAIDIGLGQEGSAVFAGLDYPF